MNNGKHYNCNLYITDTSIYEYPGKEITRPSRKINIIMCNFKSITSASKLIEGIRIEIPNLKMSYRILMANQRDSKDTFDHLEKTRNDQCNR